MLRAYLHPPPPLFPLPANHRSPPATRSIFSLRFPEFHPLLHTTNLEQTVGRRQTDRRLTAGRLCLHSLFFLFFTPFAPPILYNFPHLYTYNIYYFIIKIALYVFLNLPTRAAHFYPPFLPLQYAILPCLPIENCEGVSKHNSPVPCRGVACFRPQLAAYAAPARLSLFNRMVGFIGAQHATPCAVRRIMNHNESMRKMVLCFDTSLQLGTTCRLGHYLYASPPPRAVRP